MDDQQRQRRLTKDFAHGGISLEQMFAADAHTAAAMMGTVSAYMRTIYLFNEVWTARIKSDRWCKFSALWYGIYADVPMLIGWGRTNRFVLRLATYLESSRSKIDRYAIDRLAEMVKDCFQLDCQTGRALCSIVAEYAWAPYLSILDLPVKERDEYLELAGYVVDFYDLMPSTPAESSTALP